MEPKVLICGFNQMIKPVNFTRIYCDKVVCFRKQDEFQGFMVRMKSESEEHLEHSQTSTMEFFAKTVYGFQS